MTAGQGGKSSRTKDLSATDHQEKECDSTNGNQDALRSGEISLDASEIPLGEEPARLVRVEVEARIGMAPTPDLHGFVDEMQSDLELTPASISKYETALYASGLDPEGNSDFGPGANVSGKGVG